MLVPYRLRQGFRYFQQPLGNLVAWSLRSRELGNYTYDLTDLNKAHLAAFVSLVAGIDVNLAARYIAEPDADESLRSHVRRMTAKGPRRHVSDAASPFGRRVGWYAIVRARKPKVVVETGVDKGLGTCVLAAALLRNAAEGNPGKVFGTDINPEAGYLLASPYDGVGTVLYGDSNESLRKLDSVVDVFINDSDHSAGYEAQEYETIAPKLSDGAIVLGDNAHVTDSLFRFAMRTGRRFLFFKEEPRGHWHPGAGIGAAF